MRIALFSRRSRGGIAAFIAAFLLVAPGASAAKDDATPPWEAAEAIRTALFDARTAVLLDGASEVRSLELAEEALSGDL